ncbi:hypothetical protein INR77_04330 [Erythrobacter sp. SCSIO 43205]|uniref:hypothetical protein n=1 Tax=Erythrobacter sp. SCSIO 43205 TaxID=2779361 RepID=UPI001CA9E6FF|nr:hypothetical protein [Erythrobacter sp. SCSIO 43205]UAB78933.1 hypothetical protein INR77_04330 [Erythrobacter sp. SCSIO 43205]
MKKLILGLGAASLAFAPVAASAVEASALDRAVAPVEGENAAGAPTLLIAVLAGVAVIGGVIIAADEDDDDSDLPVSG